MILDFKILSLWFVIEYWWYNTITRENNWFLNVLVKSNFATPTSFGRHSCFVVWVCLFHYNLNSCLIHQASFSKENQWYLMHREVLGSIWKIGRYPIKVSEVLSILIFTFYIINQIYLIIFHPNSLVILEKWNILSVTEVLEQPVNESPVHNVVAIREWRHTNVDKQRKILVDVDVTPPRGAA